MCHGQNAVRHLRKEYNRLLETYSVLIMPTVPRVADEFPCEGAKIKGRSITIFCIRQTVYRENACMLSKPAVTVSRLTLGCAVFILPQL